MHTDERFVALESQVRTLKRMLFGVFGVVVVGGLLAATSLQSVPSPTGLSITETSGGNVVLYRLWDDGRVDRRMIRKNGHTPTTQLNFENKWVPAAWETNK